MRRRLFLAPIAALLLGIAAIVLPLGSTSSAVATVEPVPTLGYTVIDDGTGLCDLYSIDLATGVLTNLPAPSSDAACVLDLAVAPNRTVYGITGTQYFTVGSVRPAYDSVGGAELVTFSADGTPSGTSLTVDGLPITGISAGSIAVNAAGVVYVIGINETTCDPRLNAPGSFDPSDTYAFSCLFTVNTSTGALTQIGEGFAPNHPTYGLTSCASTLWTISPGMFPSSADTQPASIFLPWYALDPATAVPTPGGVSSLLAGYDCLPTGNTVYALTTSFLGVTANSLQPLPVRPDETLGTIDPQTGTFTPTVVLSNPHALLFSFLDFAVAPLPVVPDPVPEPVAPVFTH